MRRRPFATVLVGPSALLREGLACILGAADFRIVASGFHVQDVVPTSQHQSLLLVIDSADDPNALVAEIELFKEQHPSGRVAVLTDHYLLGDMVSAFAAGANLYFAKFVSCDAFIKALELIMLGETILPPQLLALIGGNDREREGPSTAIDQKIHRDASPPTRTDDTPRLSVREKCILRCMVEGDSNKVIARKIEIAEATVKVHVKAILRKIRVHNRTQAAIWAMNNGSWIWPADPCLPAIVDMSSPPPLAPDGPTEPVQLPPPTAHGDHANVASLTDLKSVIRKAVARRNPKAQDRTIGS
jgi:DNA-binding NarL/FixJ family response regulator